MSQTQTLTTTDTRGSYINGSMEESPKVSGYSHQNGYEYKPLWCGPSVITTIRTGKTQPFQSLLKTNNRDKTAIHKEHRIGQVFLGRLGFDGDEQTYHDHGGPEKAVLQFNVRNYLSWQDELKDVMVKDDLKRKALLSAGGMGENLAAENILPGPQMDEHTMCIGDVVGIRRVNVQDTSPSVKICVTGPRQPCFKLNHRFGIADMSLRAQTQSRTGWLYSVLEEGFVEVGYEVVLLERPYPDWPVARVQYYLYKEPRNFDMIKVLLEDLGNSLVYDVRDVFKARLEKGVEDMLGRLKGSSEREQFVQYRLRKRRQETPRISEFIFERVAQLPSESSEMVIAEPGSHIRLKFKIPHRNNLGLIRPYSIISGDSNSLRLGIALSDTSRGGSSYLHRTLQEGDILEASPTFANTFPMVDADKADNHIFIAGGIGITAFLDHIRHCRQHNISFELHYLVRNKSDIAFKSTIDSVLATRNRQSNTSSSTAVHIYDSSSKQRCDVRSLLASVSSHECTHIYTCGSERLSAAVSQSARILGISDSRLHFEQFSIDASGDPFTAKLAKSLKEVHVPAEQSLLDALRETGFEVPSSCEAGNCGTCKVRVLCGKVVHRGTGLDEDEKAGSGEGGNEQGEMLACVSRGVGEILIDL